MQPDIQRLSEYPPNEPSQNALPKNLPLIPMNRVQEYLFIIILGYSIILRFLVNNLGRTEKEEMMEEISFSVRIFRLDLWI